MNSEWQLREWRIVFKDGTDRAVSAHGVRFLKDMHDRTWISFDRLPEAGRPGVVAASADIFAVDTIDTLTPPLEVDSRLVEDAASGED